MPADCSVLLFAVGSSNSAANAVGRRSRGSAVGGPAGRGTSGVRHDRSTARERAGRAAGADRRPAAVPGRWAAAGPAARPGRRTRLGDDRAVGGSGGRDRPTPVRRCADVRRTPLAWTPWPSPRCTPAAATRRPPRTRCRAAKIAEFAAALGDDSPSYRGDDPIAPPTFVAVITTPAWELMFDDPELELTLARIVHGDQRFSYARPLRAGDVVTGALTIDKVRVRGAVGDHLRLGRDHHRRRRARSAPPRRPSCTRGTRPHEHDAPRSARSRLLAAAADRAVHPRAAGPVRRGLDRLQPDPLLRPLRGQDRRCPG